MPNLRQGGWISDVDALGTDLQQHIHALRQDLHVALYFALNNWILQSDQHFPCQSREHTAGMQGSLGSATYATLQ